MFVQAGLDDERRFNERGVTRPLASPFVKLAGYRVGDARVDNGVQASEFRAVREDESSKLDAVHAGLTVGDRWAKFAKDLFVGRLTGLNEFVRSEEHTSELQSRLHLVCRLL